MLIKSVGDLAARMREQRRRLGLTQTEVAERIGVSRHSVIRLERGNAGAEIGLVLKVLAVLGLDLDVHAQSTLGRSPAAESGDVWVPDLAAILARVRGRRP